MVSTLLNSRSAAQPSAQLSEAVLAQRVLQLWAGRRARQVALADSTSPLSCNLTDSPRQPQAFPVAVSCRQGLLRPGLCRAGACAFVLVLSDEFGSLW